MSSSPYATGEAMDDFEDAVVLDFIAIDDCDQEIQFEDIDDSP